MQFLLIHITELRDIHLDTRYINFGGVSKSRLSILVVYHAASFPEMSSPMYVLVHCKESKIDNL